MKKIIVYMLCLLIVFSAGLCGCDSQPQPQKPNPAEESGDRPVKDIPHGWDVTKNVDESFDLEQYIKDEREKWFLGRDVSLSAWCAFPWKSCNDSFEYYSSLSTVQKITGVDITCDVNLNDVNESLNLMMASGNWPDMIVVDAGLPLVQDLINAGYVYSLSELAEEYDPDFIDSVPAPVLKAGKIGEDDRFWGVVSDIPAEFSYANGEIRANLGNQGYNVRHDLWEALGCPQIDTPEALYNTLKLFKETYPMLDGKESIALGGYGNAGDGTLLTMGYSFGLKQDISIDYADNTVTTRYLDPNFEEFCVFMNRLWREGLMDPEFFVKGTQQCVEGASSNVFMMPWVYHAMDETNAILMKNDENSVFVAIPPMSATGNEFSARSIINRSNGSSITLVTKTCKDPAAALRIIRYGLSPEGSLQMYKGNPGQHYIVKDGVFYQSDEVYEASLNGNWNEWNLNQGVSDYYWFYYAPIEAGLRTYALREQYDIPNTWQYSYDGTPETYKMSLDTTTDAGIAYAYVNMTGASQQIAAITAASEEECRAIVSQMQAEIRGINNLDKLEEYWTNQFRSNLEYWGYAWGEPDPAK